MKSFASTSPYGAVLLLLVASSSVPTQCFCEPAIIPKTARLVEGVDKVSGTGLDHSLEYVVPDTGFYGPEALYLLHGACFVQLVDRYYLSSY